MTRAVLAVTGSDREHFLQSLVTNDLRGLGAAGIRYAALLTPQGRYLADFFMIARDDAILLDVDAGLAPLLLERLGRYRLRADVTIARTQITVARGTGPAPAGALPDPRHPALGWRLYGAGMQDDSTDWDALRVAHLIPETGIELTPETYILEMGFERLNGVDFRKGCYVGQEVTARMKHRSELRKGLVRVLVVGGGAAPPGTPILTADGREAGTLLTRSGGRALAWLRHDRAGGDLGAAGLRIRTDQAR